MSEIKRLFKQFSELLEEVKNGYDPVAIKNQAEYLISTNSEIADIIADEFQYEYKTGSEQLPFESPLHIGNDLRRLIVALKKKYQFE